MKCKDCKYWTLRIYGGNRTAVGDCHRFPPTKRKADADGYPAVDSWGSRTCEFEGCGEFKAKEGG